MSNHPKLEIELIDRYNRIMKMLAILPPYLKISFIGKNPEAYLKEDTYEANMETLHLLRETAGVYGLNQYYMAGCNLALDYKFKGFEVIFYCTDAENALKQVSKGKCEIIARNTVDTYKTVQCNL
ncbi:hypothetical protein N8Z76_00450 [Gammaproteobacteria bacterium]|nr:hypothetical protein [Gammaproteobacteria bacterium]